MELNKETAMRLWTKTFGKETKVCDFTGRQMVKGAYNDRKSDYGWNVDHILPQSKGGVTADYNLVCCNIKTNDEKADKFPCFKANGKKFKLVKVQNHYEIFLEDEPANDKKVSVNFYDQTSGVRFFKDLKGIQNKHCFIGTVLIRLKNLTNTAVIDFIDKIFDEENITYSMNENYYESETRIIIRNYNMPLKEDSKKLLNKCVLLNTYISNYFVPTGYINSYEIIYRDDDFEKKEMYLNADSINFDDINGDYYDSLFINDSVIKNTEVKIESSGHEYTKYNYVFTELAKNLEKEVKGK